MNGNIEQKKIKYDDIIYLVSSLLFAIFAFISNQIVFVLCLSILPFISTIAYAYKKKAFHNQHLELLGFVYFCSLCSIIGMWAYYFLTLKFDDTPKHEEEISKECLREGQ